MGVAGKSSAKVDFCQANKMDVCDITKMEYTMATTRVGRLLKDGEPCDVPKVKKEKSKEAKPYDRPVEKLVWKIGDEVQKIHVEYHMTQTLIDWGIEPVRPMWPEQDKGKIDVDV